MAFNEDQKNDFSIILNEFTKKASAFTQHYKVIIVENWFLADQPQHLFFIAGVLTEINKYLIENSTVSHQLNIDTILKLNKQFYSLEYCLTRISVPIAPFAFPSGDIQWLNN